MGRLLNWLVEDHWRVETPEEELWGIDAIVPLSYTTTKEKLTAATEAALRKAADYKKKMRQAVLAFGNCPYPFRAAEKIEAHFKGEILYREWLKSSDYLDTGDLNNSIEEAENARDTLKVNGITPKRVLIVTGEMHSRRAHYI
ncbi:MAG: hypothetical protein NUV49_02385 [Patescibacteria group bacterium]|nr:hypothetical protein [Patescibacteria group bacterium]